jgi:hypothetical protein
MNKSKLFILGILLFAGGAILSGLVIKDHPQVLNLSAQTGITRLISQVEKLIVLPSNELPTAITINDVIRLKDQPFFKNAKINDKLLVYKNIGWAVLYRPSENMIIEVGEFDINQLEALTAPSATPSPIPTAIPTPIPTPISTAIPSLIPTAIPTPTVSVLPSATPVLSPTAN